MIRRFRANRSAIASLAQAPLGASDDRLIPLPPLWADSTAPDTPINVSAGDNLFYAGDARALSRTLVAAFAASNHCFVPGVVGFTAEDDITFARAHALDKAFGTPLMAQPKAYTVSPRYAPILCVFGLGLGYHLAELLRHYDVQHLVLYEAEPALLNASLYALDWVEIARRFTGRGRSLKLIVESDAARATQAILGAFDQRSRALAVGSRYFRSYQSPTMDKVAADIAQAIPFLGYGWGYFKDECRQVLQTFENVRRPHRWLRRRWSALADGDAVVVGAGPSLELTLPLLQRIRPHVVVLSCGSAIRALLRAGIAPDLHVELETAPVNVDVIKEAADRRQIERIPMIASNGIAPAMSGLFGDTSLFVRDNSLSSQLLGRDVEAVSGCYPIVGNAAVAIAVAFGFRRITLFGVDFGYRDPRRHHAAGTIYIDDESGQARNLGDLGLGHVPILDYTDTRHRLTSIRGDELFADDIFRVSHVMLQSLLPNVPGLELRQCGDGARIWGARNLAPEEFDAADYVGDRAAMVAAMADRLEERPIDASEYARRMAGLVDAFLALARRLRRLFKRSCPDVSAFARLIGEACDLLDEGHREVPALGGLVTGTFTTYFKAIIERSFMTGSAQEQRRFIALAQAHFLTLLDAMAAGIGSFRQPEAAPA